MNKKKKICHLTTKHRADDNRILELQAIYSAQYGYDVTIIGLCENPKILENVKIIPVQTKKLKLIKQCLSLKCDLYEFHDPQLLLIGVLLRICGKKVVFDSHENYEEKIKTSILRRCSHLKPLKNIIAKLWWIYEKLCISILSGKIVADRTILKKYGKNTILLPNFPGRKFYTDLPLRNRTDDKFRLIYVGSLTWDRGIIETIQAINKTEHKNVEFHIIGDTNDKKIIEYIKNSPKTVYHGRVPWRDLKKHLVEADVGVVLLQPVDAYLYYPGENIVKLWEYMSIKLPVLISDFPKLRSLCNQLKFGLCVKPDDISEIAKAIDWMIENPEECHKFGENGKRAVEEKYNAENQVAKLFEFYNKLLNKPS